MPSDVPIAPVAAVPRLVMPGLLAGEPPNTDRVLRAAPSKSPVSVAPPSPSAPLVMAPQTGLSTALAAAMAATSEGERHADSALSAAEPRSSTPLSATFAGPPAPGSAGQDIPRQIAVQIARAAESGVGGARGTVELSLSPEELGRVRLRLHPSEAGLSVTITADRPETLELMRRNIELLAREFLDIGYEHAQFEFAHGGQGTDHENTAPDGADAPALTAARPDSEQPAPAALLAMGDRLDIRL